MVFSYGLLIGIHWHFEKHNAVIEKPIDSIESIGVTW